MIRNKLRRRFMKVFRLFRHKKYGEPLEQPKPIKYTEIEKKKLNSDIEKNDECLDTVIEEESVADSEVSMITDAVGCENYILSIVEGDLIYEIVL